MAYPSDNAGVAKNFGNMLVGLSSKQKVVIAESYGGSDEPVDQIARKVGLVASPF